MIWSIGKPPPNSDDVWISVKDREFPDHTEKRLLKKECA